MMIKHAGPQIEPVHVLYLAMVTFKLLTLEGSNRASWNHFGFPTNDENFVEGDAVVDIESSLSVSIQYKMDDEHMLRRQ